MKAPALPRTDAHEPAPARQDMTVAEQPVATKPAAAASPPGWDPFEVWRTRVFARQQTGYKKDRGIT
jgi:hypothetical protein